MRTEERINMQLGKRGKEEKESICSYCSALTVLGMQVN